MKFVAFHKATLLKALQLAALLLIYAANQAQLQAQYNPSSGTAGDDTVTANGIFTGSFFGDGGTDQVKISAETQSTSTSGYNVSLENGTVTNKGSLSSTYSGTASSIYFDGSTIEVFNNGTLDVTATTDGSNAYANGILIDGGSSDTGSIFIRNTGTINSTAGTSSSYSWAYGINVGFSSYNGHTIQIENSGSILARSSESDYSYASSVYVDAYAQYGSSNILFTNTGTLRANSGASYYSDSIAVGVSLESSSNYGSSSIQATNSGTIRAESGYAFGEDSNATGIYLQSVSDYGRSTVSFTNTASGRILVFSSGNDDDSDTIGIDASASSYYNATLSITNLGQITATGSGYTEDETSAWGIQASVGSYYGTASSVIRNAGTIQATTADCEEDNDAFGIDSRTQSQYGDVTSTILNSGSIEARSAGSDDDDSRAFAIRASASGYDGSLLLDITNSGSLSAISGYAEEEDSIARGISATMSGSASIDSPTIRITNTGSISAESGYADEEDSRATGIQADNSADDSLTEIFNSGTIQVISGEAEDDDSFATGISASSYNSGSTVRITHSGSITAHAGQADDDSRARGIFAYGGTVEVFNSGSISLSSTYGSTTGIQANGFDVTVTNAGGSIQSPDGPSISVSANNAGTVNLNGISQLQGVVEGSGGNDTLNLNLLGVTPEQAAALQIVLNGIGSGFGTFSAAGQDYEINGFENINLNAQSFAKAFSGVEGFDSLIDSLDSIDGTISPELMVLLTALGGLGQGGEVDSEEIQRILSLLTGQDVLSALGSLGVNQANQLGRALNERALALRGGSNGLDLTGLRLRDPSLLADASLISTRLDSLMAGSDSRPVSDVPTPTGLRTAPAPEPKAFNVWIRGEATLAEQEDRDGVSGYDDLTAGALIGGDYRINRNLAVGILGGANHHDVDLNSGGDIQGTSATFGTYATWEQNGWNLAALAAYVRGENDISRRFLGDTNTADTSSNAGVFHINGGYDFKAGGWKFGPTLGLQYAHIAIDGYTESGPSGLRVGDSSVDSLQSILGFHASREFDLRCVRLTPHVNGAWHHEFLNDSQSARTSFLNSPGISAFEVEGRDPERNFASVGAGISAVFTDLEMITFFVGYNGQLGQESYSAHSANAGLKIEF